MCRRPSAKKNRSVSESQIQHEPSQRQPPTVFTAHTRVELPHPLQPGFHAQSTTLTRAARRPRNTTSPNHHPHRASRYTRTHHSHALPRVSQKPISLGGNASTGVSDPTVRLMLAAPCPTPSPPRRWRSCASDSDSTGSMNCRGGASKRGECVVSRGDQERGTAAELGGVGGGGGATFSRDDFFLFNRTALRLTPFHWSAG